MSSTGPNPSGLCMCGCGKPTKIAPRTTTCKGLVKGEPMRFLPGHQSRGYLRMPDPNPSGLCRCGCGLTTPIATKSSSRSGQVRGRHVRFIQGHSTCTAPFSPDAYIVDPVTGCHIWQRCIGPQGYGDTSVDGKVRHAHIVAYERKYGPVPEGKELDHFRCDNRACCNPDHVRPVTHVENVRRGRAAKLTIEDARAIRELAASPGGLSPLDLSAFFDVSRNTIYGVLTGRYWREEVAA